MTPPIAPVRARWARRLACAVSRGAIAGFERRTETVAGMGSGAGCAGSGPGAGTGEAASAAFGGSTTAGATALARGAGGPAGAGTAGRARVSRCSRAICIDSSGVVIQTRSLLDSRGATGARPVERCRASV